MIKFRSTKFMLIPTKTKDSFEGKKPNKNKLIPRLKSSKKVMATASFFTLSLPATFSLTPPSSFVPLSAKPSKQPCKKAMAPKKQ